MSYRVGVDIGGSFTDFCALEESTGQLFTLKVLSTPQTPGSEVMNGLAELDRRFGIKPGDISYFTHGTTVGINSVIQRKGVRQVLFVTDGFRDILELARLKMPDPYNIFSRRPEPLIPRDRVIGIRERIGPEGQVEIPVDHESVRHALDRARSLGAEAIVISFLHAYRNPSHEQEVRSLLAELAPEMFVSCASDVWPAVREYERTNTAVVAGYVQPRIAHYLTSLQKALVDAGVTPDAFITTSNGGVMQAELGKTRCAQMLLSGTASGVIGAAYLAGACCADNIMSFDAGGTSIDVAMIIDGHAQHGTGELIGEFPIYVPTVSVTSVGAGGGSVASVDQHGVLKVGPESAGSSPGPACYGRGGTRPTITDAFVVCGFIGQADLGYNAITVDSEASRKAIGTLAEQLAMSIEATAGAIIDVATSGAFAEISKLYARHGAEPADYSMLAFGGAGPMLACFVARELNMKEVIVPPTPGVLSAFGGLVADAKNDFITTIYRSFTPELLDLVAETYEDLRRQSEDWLRQEQAYVGPCSFIHTAELRYEGQSHEIAVHLEGEWVQARDWERIIDAFHAEHSRIYGYADKDAVAQLINLQVTVVGPTPKPILPVGELIRVQPEPVKIARVFFEGEWMEAKVFQRVDLKPGNEFIGPAIVTQSDTTTCVPPGYCAVVDQFGNLSITAAAQSPGIIR